MEVAADIPSVTIVDGAELFPDFRGFQVDLLHPEPIAYVRAGLKLAGIIEATLD